MKRLVILFTVLIGTICVLQSCKKEEDGFYMSNSEFLREASSINRLEIIASQLAKTRSQSEAVKAYAQKLINEHTATQNEIKALADSKRINFSDGLISRHQSNYSVLNGYSDREFDASFAELMYITHGEALDTFLQVSEPTGVPDADLRAWARNAIPGMEAHYNEAVNLYNQLIAMPAK